MDHRNFTELYTQIRVLSMIETNDSISDIQLKTSFAFVTTQKAINQLEKKQLIKTEKKINKKGKARECVWYSKEHRNFCKQLIIILDRLDLYLENNIMIEPNITEILNKLQKIKIKKKDVNRQSTLEIYKE